MSRNRSRLKISKKVPFENILLGLIWSAF